MAARTEAADAEARDGEIAVRECTTVEEFDACVRLQREVFGQPEMEISPCRHLTVIRTVCIFTL